MANAPGARPPPGQASSAKSPSQSAAVPSGGPVSGATSAFAPPPTAVGAAGWGGNHFVVREKKWTIGRQYFVEDGNGKLLAFCRQKMFKLREDIRFYSDETQKTEIFRMATTKILDFNASLQVIDSASGQVVGRLARKGWKSILKDEWRILDGSGTPVGRLHEDSTGMALLRRFLPYGQMIPDHYTLLLGPEGQERPAGDIKERFQLFGDTYDLKVLPGARFDPRVLVALTVCIDAFEGE